MPFSSIYYRNIKKDHVQTSLYGWGCNQENITLQLIWKFFFLFCCCFSSYTHTHRGKILLLRWMNVRDVDVPFLFLFSRLGVKLATDRVRSSFMSSPMVLCRDNLKMRWEILLTNNMLCGFENWFLLVLIEFKCFRCIRSFFFSSSPIVICNWIKWTWLR